MSNRNQTKETKAENTLKESTIGELVAVVEVCGASALVGVVLIASAWLDVAGHKLVELSGEAMQPWEIMLLTEPVWIAPVAAFAAFAVWLVDHMTPIESSVSPFRAALFGAAGASFYVGIRIGLLYLGVVAP
jgi:hypothetical protein